MNTSINKNQKGLALVEALLVLAVAMMAVVLFKEFLGFGGLRTELNNAPLRSAMYETIRTTNMFIASYKRIPNEAELLDSLLSVPFEHSGSCRTINYADYECIFRPSGRMPPLKCDQTGWRSDKGGNQECFFRYYAGRALKSNFSLEGDSFRLYVKTFDRENTFYVFDSSQGDVLYKCPGTLTDFDTLEECYEL